MRLYYSGETPVGAVCYKAAVIGQPLGPESSKLPASVGDAADD